MMRIALMFRVSGSFQLLLWAMVSMLKPKGERVLEILKKTEERKVRVETRIIRVRNGVYDISIH